MHCRVLNYVAGQENASQNNVVSCVTADEEKSYKESCEICIYRFYIEKNLMYGLID